MNLSTIYGPRPDWAHKGNFGNVLIVCGSKLYTGSATLASIAALRAGADMVTVAAPTRAAEVAAQSMPDLMTYPLKGDYVARRHLVDIFDLVHVRHINSVVLGCGLGRHNSTVNTVKKFITKLTIPMVLDADALFAISTNPDVIYGKQVILTPHAGELAVLLGSRKVSVNFEERLAAAKQAAQRYHAIVLLKGHVDIITDGVNTITNNTGCVYMTKGGFGDTLSGIVGALLARGVGIFESAHVGAYINGKAGEMASQRLGEGLAASDSFDFIPQVIGASSVY